MGKSTKIAGLIVVSAGLAYVVKQIMHYKEHHFGWHKIKVEDEKPAGETVSHKTEAEEKRTGSRYGSNPIRY